MKKLRSYFKFYLFVFIIFPVWGDSELQITKEPIEENTPSFYRLLIKGGDVLCEHEGGNPNIEYSYDLIIDTEKVRVYLCSWRTLHRAEKTNGTSYEMVAIDLVSKKKLNFKQTAKCNSIVAGFEGNDQGKDFSFLYKTPTILTKKQVRSCLQINKINKKTYLYSTPKKPTKMYLIKGDKVTLLDEKTDDSDQKWYFINYKGKKDLNMWIKAEAVDLEAPQKQIEDENSIGKAAPKEPEPAPQTKIQTPKPIEVAKQTQETTPPKNVEVIKVKKAEPIEKSASGSISLGFLASLFGLLAWRAS